MAGEGMPQSMGGCPFGQFSIIYCTLDRFLYHKLMDMIALTFLRFRDQC